MTSPAKTMTVMATIAAMLLLSACGATRVAQSARPQPINVPQVYTAPAAGTIYSAGMDMRLFEDRKAQRVGDILTVVLAEQTNATKNSQTSTGKTTEATLSNPTVFGTPLTHKGVSLFAGSLSGDSSFDGGGSSSQSNSLAGDITVTVMERRPNGNLLISGEKWVTLNQGQEFIRLSGIIRPDDIEPDNTLLSSRIANAQITYSSKGVMAAANKMGLIGRFFNSVFHPY